MYEGLCMEQLDKGFELAALYQWEFIPKFRLVTGLTYNLIENKSQVGDYAKSYIPSINALDPDDKHGFGNYAGVKLGVYYKL